MRSRLERELSSGEWGKKKEENPTLSEFYERWISSKERNLKPSTLVSYKVAFQNHILPRLGRKRLSDLRPLDIQAFVDTLLPALADILLDHRDFMGNPAPDGFLFQTRGLRPLDPANARKRFEETLERAGLKRVTLHSLRHSYASIMLASGASIKALQRALGHSQVTMTLGTYGHLIEEKMEEAVARMDAMVRGETEGKVVRLARKKKRGERPKGV